MFGQDSEKYKKQGKQALYEWTLQQRPPLKTRLWKVFKQMLLILLATVFIVLILFLANVRRAKAGEAVHGDKPARGWFWYEDPVIEEKKKPEQAKESEKPKEPEKTVKKEEPKKDFEFPVLDTAPPVMKQFLKEPSEENAKEYLVWQYKYFEHLKKIGYNLRNAYLRHGGEIYPVYGYPESPMASVYFHNMKDDITKAAIAKARNKLGLIYFYSKSCSWCRQQKDIVVRLIDIHGLSARGVSIDGDIDTGLPFLSVSNPDLGKQYDLVQEYGITQIPTLIAVLDKNGKPRIAALSAGFAERETIEQQLVRFLIQENIIKEKDLNPVFFNR
ncbi:MAG: hypothetical protein A2X55_08920 [Nitrospirae bacterium GWB2_47_37]|nr:MAG: hypothetical protein A2X55_08920 [Nitrospirae bacterium GWB2_47_37]HAK87633.1 conjugal transfer protein TraF [Nitrospiraceae bacterium]